jgi:chorismate mutase/prephenate dehydratase
MNLEELRSEIDELDRQLVDLLNRRMRVSQRVGELKRAGPAAGGPLDVYVPDRETQLLAELERINPGPLPDAALRAIYREVLSASRALQRPLRVGYLGPPATFTYEAARRHFGHASDFVPCTTIADVFEAAERQSVDYGVVPIENSTGGAVASTLDELLETQLQICGQIELPVSHFLLSSGQLEQVKRVYSHPQALAQCRRWLAAHLPHAAQVETTSTAAAAELAREPDTAAISTESAAELYDLPILARRIEDLTTNVTRFLIIGQHMSGPTGRDRTALVFAVQDRVGALQDALRGLAENAINLTRIESRPSRRRLWEYVFFVDLDGHPRDEPVGRALDGLVNSCTFVRVLGAWPIAP